MKPPNIHAFLFNNVPVLQIQGKKELDCLSDFHNFACVQLQNNVKHSNSQVLLFCDFSVELLLLDYFDMLAIKNNILK